MAPRRSPNNRRNGNGNKRRSRPNGEIDLTQFNQRRRFRHAIAKDLEITGTSGPTVDIYQVGISTVGATPNKLARKLFNSDGLDGSWQIEQVRVRAIDVVFDARGINPATVFNQRARVGCFLSPDPAANFDVTKMSAEIGNYTPHAMNPNATKTVRLRLGPEFSLGRFGGDRPNMSLVIVGNGFQGSVRVITHLETTGFPGTRLDVIDRTAESPLEVHFPPRLPVAPLEIKEQDVAAGTHMEGV
jgi:hypothetical protein